ncbi:uncharacterized protein K02A2.6 [Trichonephila clavipes]|nr:uncharacterized protein K02A2.6 [Trichonephila clavipes]
MDVTGKKTYIQNSGHKIVDEFKVRTVPFALKGRVENEIDRLEKEGIIEKVDSSEWATPVVPVVKSDGSIRLCADYSDKLRRDNFEFRDRKFDVGDRVAVRVYRAANTRWKFGTIVNQDGVLHYIIDVQGTLVRRHADQIRPVGIKCKKNIIPLMHQRFPSSEVLRKTTLIFSMQKRRKIFLMIGTRNWVHLPYKECHQTDVAVPDLSQSSAKERLTLRDEESTSSRQAISRRSGRT